MSWVFTKILGVPWHSTTLNLTLSYGEYNGRITKTRLKTAPSWAPRPNAWSRPWSGTWWPAARRHPSHGMAPFPAVVVHVGWPGSPRRLCAPTLRSVAHLWPTPIRPRRCQPYSAPQSPCRRLIRYRRHRAPHPRTRPPSPPNPPKDCARDPRVVARLLGLRITDEPPHAEADVLNLRLRRRDL